MVLFIGFWVTSVNVQGTLLVAGSQTLMSPCAGLSFCTGLCLMVSVSSVPRREYPDGYYHSKGWSSQSDYYASYYSGQYDYGGVYLGPTSLHGLPYGCFQP